MADILFSNTASSLLNTSINSSILTIELQAGFGARFPSPSGAQYMLVTLEDDQGNFEIVKVESRSNDLLTVEAGGRGYDNTTAQAFTQNVTRVELRLVAATMNEMLQVNGDTMVGNLAMGGNSITDAVLSGGSTQMLAGEVVGVPLRGDIGTSTNEISVPSGGGRATAGGAEVIVVGDDLMQYLDVAGTIDFSSATVGVQINDGYLQVSNPGVTEFLRVSSDDAGDIDIAFTGVTDANITGASLFLGASVTVQMEDNILDQPQIQDYSLTVNPVTAIGGTTEIDYELGSYVTLDMAITTTLLSIINPPATGKLGSLRIKIVQDGVGSKLITAWPAGTKWPGGNVPVLSVGANAEDFVDMWTDDAGATWYAVFNEGWA